jgi:hypothetical protein
VAQILHRLNIRKREFDTLKNKLPPWMKKFIGWR